MDIKELKTYIYNNRYVEQILESIGCHHIKYHTSNRYWTCANADGDNNGAIVIYDNEYLLCTNYTRQMINGTRKTDIIDLVCYTKKLSFPDGLKFICEEIGISYYHDFEDDIPESFKVLKLIEEMGMGSTVNNDKPLKPIDEHILSYYKPYVNDLFSNDGIDYDTQKIFEVGYDEESNRYTIPIRSELGDLVGVKGRYFERDVPAGSMKYIYIEPCARSKILYGLNKTIDYIKSKGCVYVLESEKAVMQLWGYGYRNSVSTGGKELAQYQIDMLVRLGSTIIFCFDKDVTKDELENLANRFPDGVPLFYMYDEDNILNEHESPSDSSIKWQYMVKNNIYKLR